MICGKKRELEVHHIIPQVFKGLDIRTNTLTLCSYCHDIVTAYCNSVIDRHKTGENVRQATREQTKSLADQFAGVDTSGFHMISSLHNIVPHTQIDITH